MTTKGVELPVPPEPARLEVRTAASRCRTYGSRESQACFGEDMACTQRNRVGLAVCYFRVRVFRRWSHRALMMRSVSWYSVDSVDNIGVARESGHEHHILLHMVDFVPMRPSLHDKFCLAKAWHPRPGH